MIFIWFTLSVFGAIKCLNQCKKIDQYCYCDDKCIDFGDCCPGHDYFQKIGILENLATCKLFAKYSYSNMWVIDKCENPNHNLAKYCTKQSIHSNIPIKSFVPVMGENKLIYENFYCAKCNNIKRYRYFNLSITCPNENITNFNDANEVMKKSPGKCIVSPLIDINYQRFCFNNLTRLCPELSINNQLKNNSKICKNGNVNIVTDGNNYYKNKYCCECRNITCFNPQASFDIYSGMFSYVLNFKEWDDDNQNDTNSKSLTKNQTNTKENITITYSIFYVSFVFTCLSIFSLTILILLYTTQRIFHNFGGYLTVCLSCCLWLMNFITIIATNPTVIQSTFCRYLAIFQHFITLSTFVWMALYALDLLQTFGFKSTNMGKKKTWKTFCFYSITGFCCVGAFVGISSVVEFTMSSNSTIRPKYGGKHCWFTSKLGGIIWYFIPVCLLLLWNFGTCIIVFYRIMKTSKECRVVKKEESSSTLWICIRLTAVFGIGYVFQIFAVLSEVSILIITGSLLNCLQGCFLAICFIWAKRVRAIVTNTFTSLTDNISKSTNYGKSSQTQNTNLDDETIHTNVVCKSTIKPK